MVIVVTILMYTTSLKLQLPACVTIYNQCSNIKLLSPIYFSNGAVCSQLSGRKIDVVTKARVCFEISPTQDDFEGALLFKLQRYSNSQYNMNALDTETNNNETTHIHILIVWKMKESKPFLHIALVKHTKEFTWNEDELRKLYDKNRGWLREYHNTTSNAWLMDNNMVLKMISKIRGTRECFELSIFISEEVGDKYAMKPLCIDTRR
jgi:hypothetical protein